MGRIVFALCIGFAVAAATPTPTLSESRTLTAVAPSASATIAISRSEAVTVAVAPPTRTVSATLPPSNTGPLSMTMTAVLVVAPEREVSVIPDAQREAIKATGAASTAITAVSGPSALVTANIASDISTLLNCVLLLEDDEIEDPDWTRHPTQLMIGGSMHRGAIIMNPVLIITVCLSWWTVSRHVHDAGTIASPMWHQLHRVLGFAGATLFYVLPPSVCSSAVHILQFPQEPLAWKVIAVAMMLMYCAACGWLFRTLRVKRAAFGWWEPEDDDDDRRGSLVVRFCRPDGEWCVWEDEGDTDAFTRTQLFRRDMGRFIEEFRRKFVGLVHTSITPSLIAAVSAIRPSSEGGCLAVGFCQAFLLFAMLIFYMVTRFHCVPCVRVATVLSSACLATASAVATAAQVSGGLTSGSATAFAFLVVLAESSVMLAQICEMGYWSLEAIRRRAPGSDEEEMTTTTDDTSSTTTDASDTATGEALQNPLLSAAALPGVSAPNDSLQKSDFENL